MIRFMKITVLSPKIEHLVYDMDQRSSLQLMDSNTRDEIFFQLSNDIISSDTFTWAEFNVEKTDKEMLE